jgi:cell shape-determining protein MreC
MVHQPTSRKGLLVATVAALAIASMLPPQLGRWAQAFGYAATLLIAPVTRPVTDVRAFLMRDPGESNPTENEQLARERDHFRTLWLQEQDRVREMRRVVEELQRGALASELPLGRLHRPVIGGASDGAGGQLQVQAGTKEGVEVNAIATTAGVQLAGKVVRTTPRTCWVRLITDAKGGPVRGVVMLPEDARGSKVLLYPITGGRLQGMVEYGTGPEAQVGQVVRLADPEWPKSAQNLELGTIVSIDRGVNQRQRIIVKPRVDLDRLSELVVVFPLAQEGERLAGDSKRPSDGGRP